MLQETYNNPDMECWRIDVDTYQFLACNALAQEWITEYLELQNTGSNVRKMTVNGWENAAVDIALMESDGLKVWGSTGTHMALQNRHAHPVTS